LQTIHKNVAQYLQVMRTEYSFFGTLLFPSVLTLLAWEQEWHPACENVPQLSLKIFFFWGDPASAGLVLKPKPCF